MNTNARRPSASPDQRPHDEAEVRAEFFRRGRQSLADTLATGKLFSVDEVVDDMRVRLRKKLADALQQR